jgi:hypothetical protein
VTPALNYQLLRLSSLLQLEQRARKATGRELEFLMVNDTATIVPYQQAALLVEDEGGRERILLSGVAQPDEGGPYRIWLKRVLAALRREARAGETHAVTPEDLSEDLAREWLEWLPPHVLWCPLGWRGGRLGGMLLARAEPWLEGDVQLVEGLAEAYGQSMALAALGYRLRRRVASRLPRRRLLALGAVILIVAVALLPVRESVLAPAEIVPVDPAPVRAPFDGVVDALHVTPNQPVHAGQALVSLDPTQLRTRYAVAEKALDMAQAEYTSAAQQAMSDAKANSQLATLLSKVEQQRAEMTYDKAMLDRAALTAPADGIAVFDDNDEWIGKPVELGERIMLVASPRNTELEVQVPAASVVTFDPGSKIVFFSNIAPDHPVAGRLAFASYSSAMTAEGVLAYAFRAKLQPAAGEDLRLGLKGTAKIYGPRRMLALWLLRRPIAVVREWLSL